MSKETQRIDSLGIDDLKIIQDTKYFCFGMDSIILANFVESISTNNVIVDLCSGTGVIPTIISAKCKYKKIFGVELQKEMFDLFSENLKLNKLEDKIVGLNNDIKDIDLIRKSVMEITGKENVDIVVSNPPYKKIGTGTINDNDVKYIARHEAMCNLEDIFITSSKLLKSRGKLYLVHKPERLVDLLDISRKYNLEAKRLKFVYPKVNSAPSIVVIEYMKDGKDELKVLPPLIEYGEDGKYTDDIYKIYGMKRKEEYNDGK